MSLVAVKGKVVARAPRNDIDSHDVYSWAKRRRVFTTEDLVSAFKLRTTRAAAFLAVMKMQGRIIDAGKTDAGASIWAVVRGRDGVRLQRRAA